MITDCSVCCHYMCWSYVCNYWYTCSTGRNKRGVPKASLMGSYTDTTLHCHIVSVKAFKFGVQLLHCKIYIPEGQMHTMIQVTRSSNYCNTEQLEQIYFFCNICITSFLQEVCREIFFWTRSRSNEIILFSNLIHV